MYIDVCALIYCTFIIFFASHIRTDGRLHLVESLEYRRNAGEWVDHPIYASNFVLMHLILIGQLSYYGSWLLIYRYKRSSSQLFLFLLNAFITTFNKANFLSFIILLAKIKKERKEIVPWCFPPCQLKH